MNKKFNKLHIELTDLGYQAEDLMNGNKNTKQINKRVEEIKKEMYEEKILLDNDFAYIDENDIEGELEHASQFIQL